MKKLFGIRHCLAVILTSVVLQISAQTKMPQVRNPLPAKKPATSTVKGNQFTSLKTKKDNSIDYDKTDYSYWFRFKGTAITSDNFFQSLREELRIGQKDSFKLTRTSEDELGFKHYTYWQLHNGVPVEGGAFFLHEKNGQLQKANGNFYDGLNISATPNISEQEAIEFAKRALEGESHRSSTPEIVIAPINGNYQTESFKLCYKVNVETWNPLQIYDVFVDAHNGSIINKISKITDADAIGSASTFYSGTQTITTDSDSGGYRLRESGRKIETYNAINFRIDSIPTDYEDADNVWGQVPRLDILLINTISQSWWYNQIVDANPDLYIKIKNGLGQTVYTSTHYDNLPPPIYFFPNLYLTNFPYTVEIWDYDFGSSDDFGNSFTLLAANGTHVWSGNGNIGGYLIDAPNNPALDVHWGMEKTYDYFLNIHNRNSYNGNGDTIRNLFNPPPQLLPNRNNATALPAPYNIMLYGLGDSILMGPVVGLDVAGHEYSHLVINNNGNGGLYYQNESGALNESFADIFGTAIEFYSGVTPDWTIGESVVLISPYYLRSMSNPNSGLNRQPDTYTGDFWKPLIQSTYPTQPPDTTEDNGGVHANSGVQNHWFYLLSVGGSGWNNGRTSHALQNNGYPWSVTGIGITKAEKIAYRNLTTYLTSNATYQDAYMGSLEAVRDLFVNQSQEFNATKSAWYAVGIAPSPTGNCGGTTTFTTASGSFTDGSGSANYLNLTDCMWLIQPAGANDITLTFSSFNTELDYDGVIIFDGPDTSAPVLLVHTGTTLPAATTSTGGAMLVWFVSDSTITGAGWAASYSSTGTAYCNGLTVLSSYSGSFTDGSGANNYGNNSECYWHIAPPGATSVTLSFASFNTELNYDGVLIFDDVNDTVPVVYSGATLPSPITSNTGEMLVVFLSDYTVTAGGFNASYTATGIPYCSGTDTLNGDNDIFNDGSGSNNYYNNSSCSWLIQPANAVSITLTFTEFDLEQPSTDGTVYDYVEVYDGSNASSPLLGKFSGSNIPPSLSSTGASMFVRFVSDGGLTANGWEAYYLTNTTTYCNGQTILTDTSGILNDGSGASQYGNNTDCIWLIQPTNASSITLTFTSFDTEQGYDGVIVYDGSDTTADVLGTFTGASLPSPATSTGGSMLVWFVSDPSIRKNGWSANYTSASQRLNIGGAVKSELGAPISSAKINLSGTSADSLMTAANGLYSFDVQQNGSYTATPSKGADSSYSNCVSTLDILVVRRHILNNQLLPTPYRIIAGDVNASGSVSTLDILQMRALILGSIPTFPNGKLWTFVPDDYAFPNPQNPFPYPTNRTYSNITISHTSDDFIGLTLGDVNNSCDPASPKMGAAGEIQFFIDEQKAQYLDKIIIPIKVKDFRTITGYQFTLSWDASVLSLLEVTNKALQGYYGEHRKDEGYLTTTWYDEMTKAVTLDDDAVAFELKFKVIGSNGSFSPIIIGSELTTSEAYNENLDLLSIVPQNGMVKVGDESSMVNSQWSIVNLRVVPNPFSKTTNIIFTLPQDETVTLTIYDILGREVKRVEASYLAGKHKVEWSGADEHGTPLSKGLYHVRMVAGANSQSAKVVMMR